MSSPPGYEVGEPGKDRLVRARKRRACTVPGCSTVVEPGELYVDVNPPERQPGYFAQCVPCSLAVGLIVEAAPGRTL